MVSQLKGEHDLIKASSIATVNKNDTVLHSFSPLCYINGFKNRIHIKMIADLPYLLIRSHEYVLWTLFCKWNVQRSRRK